MFWGVVVLATWGAAPVLGGVWIATRWRAARRNRRGECAGCGTALHEIHPFERFVVEGRIVCPDCAERSRRRVARGFGLLALGAAAGTGIALAGAEVAAMALLPAAATLGMTVGAVHLMKRANRRTQRRIATLETTGLPAPSGIIGGQPAE